ncbi:glycine betaine ABC transporter substrate-binding protein [Kineococcus sp. SYSU DK006]|uniref:ABC transporter substrate-binding protein n=1 Tax=Kineococcus sp. SYSU DK006 TaxID=3383127 RepID=UPI003D7C3779
MNRRNLLLGALLIPATTAMAACGGGDLLSTDSVTDAAGDSATIVVGSANFPESEVLAEMYAQILESKGLSVQRRFSIGSREIYVKALQDGSIDLIPEYNGALLTYLAGDQEVDALTTQDVQAALQDRLPAGLTLLQPAQAQDKNEVVVTAETARKYQLSTIADLAPHAADFVIGAGPEFQERRQGLVGLREVYGLTFSSFTALDAGGPITIQALKQDRVHVASLLSTDPAIQLNGFVRLTDPENLFGVQNVLPLVRTAKNDDTVSAALNKLAAVLTTEDLTAALGRLTIDHDSIADIAADYLRDEQLV